MVWTYVCWYAYVLCVREPVLLLWSWSVSVEQFKCSWLVWSAVQLGTHWLRHVCFGSSTKSRWRSTVTGIKPISTGYLTTDLLQFIRFISALIFGWCRSWNNPNFWQYVLLLNRFNLLVIKLVIVFTINQCLLVAGSFAMLWCPCYKFIIRYFHYPLPYLRLIEIWLRSYYSRNCFVRYYLLVSASSSIIAGFRFKTTTSYSWQ